MKHKSRKVFVLIILGLFLLPSFNPITEELFNITGLKSSSADFRAISNSDNPTRWIIQEADLTAVEDFHDDISGSNWNLYDVSEDSFYASPSSSYLTDNTTGSNEWDYMNIHFDVGVQDGTPVGITWDGTYFWILGDDNDEVYKYTSAGVYTTTHFDTGAQDTYQRDIVWDGSYFWVLGGITAMAYKYTSAGVYAGSYIDVGLEDSAPLGITWDGSYYWITGAINNRIYKYTSAGVYTGTNFYVGAVVSVPRGITWDGTHLWILTESGDEVYRYTTAGVYTGNHFDVGTEDGSPYGITWDGTYFWIVGRSGKEVFKYENLLDVSKIYQGSGYMYMQTDETELISLSSGDYGTHKTLSSGDYFEIDFQTSSDSQIDLILLKDGDVNKTLTLSQSGNTNFNRHTVQISTNELVEFDQLKISTTFEDEDYVKVYDIKTFKYTLTGDHADFILPKHSAYTVNLSSETYNIRIFDPFDGDVKININKTLGTGYYEYSYTPTGTLECRLTLFNIGKENSLNFIDYHIDIIRSLNGEWDDFRLLDNIFIADIETYVNITVYDRFDTLINSFERLASDYIDLELEVYQLQIKNLMTEKTVLDINNSLFVNPLLSGDSIYFTLSTAHYTIQYYDTNNVERIFTIFLDSNQAYELNRSQICFLSYTDEQGNHLFFEDYMTYLNGSLIYEKVFYEEIGTDVHINITDRYDVNIYIGTYTVLASNNYIPIILEVYELKLMNMQNEFNGIVIERSPFPIVGTVGDIVESGHYPATYSFTDEADGTSGTDIDWVYSESITSNGGTLEIVDVKNGHKKVLYIATATTYDICKDNFLAQTKGTIEFWHYKHLTNTGSRLSLRNNAGQPTVLLRFTHNGFIHYYDNEGVFQDTGATYSADTWHHVKIEFDCGADTFNLYVDGVNYEIGTAFACTVNSITNLRFGSDSSATIEIYIDAIGYSFDENYLIGDNLHDNFYLGYEPFEQYNQTEIGDYTGTYSFDNYTEPEVYYGTYDFRDDAIGGNPEGWVIVDETGGTINIIASIGGHKKVLELNDTSNTNLVSIYNPFTARESGTYEFWVRTTNKAKQISLYLRSSSTSKIVMVLGYGWFAYYDLLGNFQTLMAPNNNEWYHVRIDFECGGDAYEGLVADHFHCYINGVKYPDLEFRVVSTTISNLYFATIGVHDNYIGYVDAVGYSWDTISHFGHGYDPTWNANPYDLEPILETFDTVEMVHNTSISVVSHLDGHNNVLNITDDTAVGTILVKDSFPIAQTSGSFELWFRTTDNGDVITFYLYDGTTIAIRMYFRHSSDLKGYNGAALTIIDGAPPINTWRHFKIVFDCDTDIWGFYLDGVEQFTDWHFHTVVDEIDGMYIGTTNQFSYDFSCYFDALGFTGDPNYDVGDNINSHGQGIIDEMKNEGWTFYDYVYVSYGISGEYNSHKKILNLTASSTIFRNHVSSPFSSQTIGTVEFWIKTDDVVKMSRFIMWEGSTVIVDFRIDTTNFEYHDGIKNDISGITPVNDVWYHIKLVFSCTTDTYEIWIDNVQYEASADFIAVATTLNKISLLTDTTDSGYSLYYDAIAYSWDSGYYVGDNRNFYDVESEYSWTTNIAPDEVVSFRLLKGFYNIWMTSSEETISYSFRMFADNYFILNRSQMCFLSYTNQRGEYLEFNNYKTYWNGTLLYENVFYERIGRNASIEIKDHYDISVKNHSFIVNSGDNYVPVILTMYSLKVMSQQLCFNHINITRDPNYYDSDYYWSEWIAPSEIIEFTLFAGYYKINLTNNEAESSSCYEYTLNGDDVLLIGSNNTIYNVLINIANVNTTIGNQITNVQIDLTNQNSQINNSVINIEINLGNINSTLGNMLVNLDLDITNVANNISALYVFTENSFINLGNNINTSFIYIENNIISINQSISNLVIGVSNSVYLINGTISTMITQMENNLLLMNLSIDTALFDLDTTVVEIGNNITNNYILLNNSIVLANNNINDSRIAIINNLALINNTISNLISQVFSSVYMINNSIYTAVIDVGTSLMLVNNSISGNLSIILQMNDALTELYRKTMFSALLNWTDIGYNTSLITSQIDAWDFINHYKNQSIEVHLRFQDVIDKLVVTANNYKTQWLPNYDTEYRLWSIKKQKYLEPWKPLPKNKTVNFGFFEEDVPIAPRPLEADFYTLIAFIIIICVFGWVIVIAYVYMKKDRDIVPEDTRLRHKRKRKAYVDRKKGFYDHT